MANSETIDWISVDDDKPDEGIVVLLNAPAASDAVWPGLLDSGEWRWADQSRVNEEVVAWAEMPLGKQ